MFTLATSLIFCLVLISLVKTGFLGVVASLSSVLAAFTVVNIVVLNVGFLLPVAFGKRARVPAVLYDLSRLRLVAASALVARTTPTRRRVQTPTSNSSPGISLGSRRLWRSLGFFPQRCVVVSSSPSTCSRKPCHSLHGFSIRFRRS
ncbi:hypothetical protein B0H14DRAFT_2918178 [Mycena olivaceomarginata]|nr:hypothetical protein B0H14DRAFT_2918178 [Mycena olivaceomarginata]